MRQRFCDLSHASEFLEEVPIAEALFLGLEQELRRVPVLVELLGKAPLRSRKGDEVTYFSRLGVLVPILVGRWVAR